MDELTIVNMAHMRAGLDPAAVLADCSWIAAFSFEQCANELLREHGWNFARKITTLSQTGGAVPGYLKTYALPSDFIKAIDVHGCSDMRAPKASYELLGKTLACNVTPCYLRYVSSATPVANYTWDFAHALSLRIAYKISSLASQTMGVAREILQEMMAATRTAIENDAKENQQRVPHDNSIYLTRGGLGPWGPHGGAFMYGPPQMQQGQG